MEKEVVEFEIQEEDIEESNAEKLDKKVRCWVGTWNNQTMTDEEFKSHLEELYSQDYLKYAVFQREKGEETGTIHLQFFLDFKNARKFKWVKKNLPYGCHFKPMRSTKIHCRDYCSKEDTRISKTYYEIGEFIEERQRTDLATIMNLVKLGTPFEAIQEIYPTQCIMYKRQIVEYAQGLHNSNNRKKLRDIKVTYVYGSPGTGKTSWFYNNHDFELVYMVDMYDKSMFTHYTNEKILLFDEFTGKVDITYMNKLLDRYPVQLRGLNTVKYAGFEEVYIISNMSLDKLYKKEQEENIEIYNAFLRRIGRVIRFDKMGIKHIEKDVYKDGVQCEISSEELPFNEN